MPLLIIAALIWIAIHLGLAGTSLRHAVVERIGGGPFRGVFSLLSIAALVEHFAVGCARLAALVAGSRHAPGVRLVCRLGQRAEPHDDRLERWRRSVAPRRHQGDTTSDAVVVRDLGGRAHHWNGDAAAIIFFGAFLGTALAGMPSIDAKLARRDRETWQAVSGATSIVPFVAIAQGRNRFAAGELGWLVPAIAGVAWIVMLLAHPWLFGVAAAVP